MQQRRIDHYSIGRTLGRGASGKVKYGVDIRTHTPVALKIISKTKPSNVFHAPHIYNNNNPLDPFSNDSLHQPTIRELTSLRLLHHENIIQLIEVNFKAQYPKSNGRGTKEVILIVLEYATGGELFDILSRTGRMDELLSRTYFHQLINGISYCHVNHIAHRDLKLENLLLSNTFMLKIADFGFANKFSVEQPLLITQCGTIGYMAPEIFKSGNTANSGYDPAKADIWSCGVILFTLYAGFPPFQKAVRTDWWFDKLYTKRHELFWKAHERCVQFPESFKSFIERILDPNPSTRITINEMTNHAWFRGDSLGDAALTKEIDKRREIIAEALRAEREEREKMLKTKYHFDGMQDIGEFYLTEEQLALGGSYDMLIEPAYRSANNNSVNDENGSNGVSSSISAFALENLPPTIPKFSKPEITETEIPVKLEEFGGSKEDITWLSEDPSAEALSVYNPIGGIPCINTINAHGPLPHIYSRLQELCRSKQWPFHVNPLEPKIKIQPHSNLIITIYLWKGYSNSEITTSISQSKGLNPTSQNDCVVLEFRRAGGNVALFTDSVDAIIDSLVEFAKPQERK